MKNYNLPLSVLYILLLLCSGTTTASDSFNNVNEYEQLKRIEIAQATRDHRKNANPTPTTQPAPRITIRGQRLIAPSGVTLEPAPDNGVAAKGLLGSLIEKLDRKCGCDKSGACTVSYNREKTVAVCGNNANKPCHGTCAWRRQTGGQVVAPQ